MARYITVAAMFSEGELDDAAWLANTLGLSLPDLVRIAVKEKVAAFKDPPLRPGQSRDRSATPAPRRTRTSR